MAVVCLLIVALYALVSSFAFAAIAASNLFCPACFRLRGLGVTAQFLMALVVSSVRLSSPCWCVRVSVHCCSFVSFAVPAKARARPPRRDHGETRVNVKIVVLGKPIVANSEGRFQSNINKQTQAPPFEVKASKRTKQREDRRLNATDGEKGGEEGEHERNATGLS